MTRNPLRARYPGWALVAGAAQGIGRAFAARLAAEGFDLLLLDADQPALGALTAELGARAGVRVLAQRMDLGALDVLDQLEVILAREGVTEVGLLVYNAAHSFVGSFLEQGLASKEATLTVNCRGPLLLAHRFAPAMAARGRGALIFMSSLAGVQGHRLTAAYAASKAFELILAQALWDELRPRGVDVLAVCAGMTRTPGFLASRPVLDRFKARLVMEPEAVVAEAFRALGRRPAVVTGWPNRLTALLVKRLLPGRAASAFMGRMVGQVYPGRMEGT